MTALRALPSRLRAERHLQALAVLLLLGAAMRIGLTVQWRPAFVGYSDSGIYFQGAFQDIWSDPIRTVGYAVVLDVLHAVSPHLVLATILQHALGLTCGLLLYATLRRTAAPPWVAVVGAGAILVGGSQVMLEHAALSEGIHTPVLVLGLYAAVRAQAGSARWAILAGLCAGIGVTLKGVGIALIPVLVLCLAFAPRRPTRASLHAAGFAGACAVLVLTVYIGVRQAQSTGHGLTSNGNWNLYGRVAPWADCTKFTAPKGTEPLCDDLPIGQRLGGAEFYIFDNRSPGIRYAGPAFQISPTPGAMTTFGRFSRAAILGQPGDYLAAVWDDARRLVDLDHPSLGQATPRQLQGQLQNGLADGTPTGNAFVESWRVLLYPNDTTSHGSVRAFSTWERWTTPRGPLMLLAMLLAAAAPFAVPRGTRFAASLLSATAFVLLLFPIATKAYDYRFVIPAIGPLAAAAALGAWGLRERVSGRRRRASAAPSGAAPHRAPAAHTTA